MEMTQEQQRALALAAARMRMAESSTGLRASMDAGSVESDPGPSVMRTVAQAMRAASNGLTFNNTDRIAAALNAAVGNGDYAGNLAGQRKESSKFSREHPFWDLPANIAGASVLPLGVFGAAANRSTMIGRTLAGAGTGAVLGGAAGAGASPDWTDLKQLGKDTAWGMGTGAGIGGTIPGASAAIGKGYNKIATALAGDASGMSSGASKELIPALKADGPDAVKAELARLGPQAMLADTGFALQGKASGAALNNDEARSVVFRNLKGRDAATNERISSDVNRALGPAEDPQTVKSYIDAHRTATDNVAYPAALQGAPAISTAPILTQVDHMLTQTPAGSMERRALTNLRGMLMTTERRPLLDAQGHPQYDNLGHERWQEVPVSQNDANVLHKVKMEMDRVINYDEPGLGLPPGAAKTAQGTLKNLRYQINDALEQQVPGYREANSASSALAKRAEAVGEGTQYLGSGKTTPSPERFAAEFAQKPGQQEPRSIGEQIAFAKGSRGEIDRVLGVKANDLQALKGELQGEGGWNTAKIATVHGQEAADELAASVDRNLKFRDTHNKVVENAQTAQRTAAKEAMSPNPPNDLPDLIQPSSTFFGTLATAGKRLANAAYHGMQEDPTRHYPEIAQVVTAQGPEAEQFRAALAAALMRREGIDASTKAVGTGAGLSASILANALLQRRPATQTAD